MATKKTTETCKQAVKIIKKKKILLVIKYYNYYLLDKCMSVLIYLIRKINKTLQNFYTLEHVFTMYAFNAYGTVAVTCFQKHEWQI